MVDIQNRTIIKQGTSLVITLPSQILIDNNIQLGDKVDVSLTKITDSDRLAGLINAEMKRQNTNKLIITKK